MSYYRKKVYDSHNVDSGLNARTGQVVEVLRELTDREADIADVGRMFHVRFADGFETDVFEDELEVHDTVKIIVDGTNTFQVVDSVPLGYVIWNIGNNMADGYLPLCQVGGPDGCQVNPDTLKAVKCDGSQTIPEEYRTESKNRHSCTYRRLAWNEPSPTIVNWRKPPLIHPLENRTLTVAEAKALQGLPKDFRICGTLGQMQQQVGNSVPVAIGEFIKRCILRILQAQRQVQFA